MAATIDDLRYPVGRQQFSTAPDARRQAIAEIAALPARIREAVAGLTDAQLDTPYRPGGWTVRQVVHDENAFSTLADMRLPVEISLDLLDGVHTRWVALYAGMADADFARTFFHPEHGKSFTLDEQAQSYGWHSRHHVAHITALRQRERW
jgi:hypothetical protein